MWLRGAAPSSAKGSPIQALGGPNLKTRTNTHNHLPDINLHTNAAAHRAPRHWLSYSTPPDPKKKTKIPKISSTTNDVADKGRTSTVARPSQRAADTAVKGRCTANLLVLN